MYSRSQLRRGLRNPNLFFRELNRLYHRRLYSRKYNTSGVDIFYEDWDNLIVLDACRYDLFRDRYRGEGKLEDRISRGSSTTEWLRGNFKDEKLLDTVYITANPQFYRHQDWLNTRFHAVEHIWKEEGWDESRMTVLPETTTKSALEVAEEYPSKRIIIHYIQPHYPFLTEDKQPFDDEQAFFNPDEVDSWIQMMTGELNTDREVIWQAYQETLDRTLPLVEKIITKLEGKSIVTADHGNMVGDRARPFPIREWGHPRGIYTEELVKVPWLVIDNERREITVEESTDTQIDIADDTVKERLADLGYR